MFYMLIIKTRLSFMCDLVLIECRCVHGITDWVVFQLDGLHQCYDIQYIFYIQESLLQESHGQFLFVIVVNWKHMLLNEVFGIFRLVLVVIIARSWCRLIWTVQISMLTFRSLPFLSAFHLPYLWVNETIHGLVILICKI